MLRSPHFSETWSYDRKVNFSVYISADVERGVSQWNILFGCVRVGHRCMENQNLAHVVRIFHQVHPKGEFLTIGVQILQVMSVKPVTPRIRIFALSTSWGTCVHMIRLHI